MKVGIFAATLVAATLGVSSWAAAQEECPMGKPRTLVRGIIPVVGEGPLWAAAGNNPIKWVGPEEAVGVLWVRDQEVPGVTMISGAHRTSGVKAQFGQTKSALGARNERYRLDNLGIKLDGVAQNDLRRYSFHPGAMWFPEPGCYEITARVGRADAQLYLNVEKE